MDINHKRFRLFRMVSAVNSSAISAFHRALQRWYKKYGRRDLPWRNTHDSYAIYISEIMLQQTQVKTVLEKYYLPFLKTFPTLAALAKADKQKVMKQWEGLGYYNRAANLHKAAQLCKDALPKTAEALQALPGIGRNTASAIACFAFRQAVPVMEANVKRVLYRVFALKKADENTLWEKAGILLNKKNPFDYNQAMMDIGALVCTRRNPRCNVCPLNILCKGQASPKSYPAPKTRKSIPVRKRIIVVMRDEDGNYYLQKRESKFLHGLYGFPEYEADVTSILHNNKRCPLKGARMIGQVTQTYSHFMLQAKVYLLSVTDKKGGQKSLQKATFGEMKTLPLSRADHKVLALLAQAES